MESEIAQLKKEIEQLKKENNKLRCRYVPDEEDTQETFVVEIEEDSDDYIVKTECIGKPMWGIWDEKDNDDKIYYLKALPSASVFQHYALNKFFDLIVKYDGCVKPLCHKFIIPKSSCDRKQLMDDIVDGLFETRNELGWYSKYGCNEDDSEDDTTDSEEYEDDEDFLTSIECVDEYDDEYDEECAPIDMSIFNRPDAKNAD